MDKDVKISQAFRIYEASEIRPAGLANSTAESYRNASKLIVEFIGDTPVENLCIEDVQGFYEHLLGWQKPDTARGNIICLRSVLKYCRRKGVGSIDIEDIKIPKREKRTITYLTPSEIEAFIEVVGAKRRGYSKLNRIRNVAIVELLYATGLRISELCALNKNSIKNRQFTVVGKSKEPRICFITPRVENILCDYLKLREDKCPALFISNQNGKRIRPDNIRTVFQNACKRSDFENIHPHTIRHSFATKMLERGVDIRYIAALLGHESLDTTKIYTHYSNPRLKAVYDMAQG